MTWKFCKITDISEDEYKSVYEALTPSRKAHIDRMKKADDRKRSLLATYLAEKLLSEAGMGACKIEIDESGKPYVADRRICISLSHSHEAAACAISEEPIGIDIEKIRPVQEKLINYVCTEREKEYVLRGKNDKGNDTQSIEHRFFAVWTAKEAFYKKSNDGIKNICAIDTISLDRQVFIVDDYIVTVL